VGVLGTSDPFGAYRANPTGTGQVGGNQAFGATGNFGQGLNALGGTNRGLAGGRAGAAGLGNLGGLNSRAGLTNLGGIGALGGRGGLATGQFGMNNMAGGRTRGMNTTGTAVQAPGYILRAGFTNPQPPASTPEIQVRVQRVLTAAPSLAGVRGVSLTMDGATVVLRGTASTDYEKQLAETLARLEPGVYDLRNEIQVQGASAAAAGSTTGGRAP
jgi:hypothetical protein